MSGMSQLESDFRFTFATSRTALAENLYPSYLQVVPELSVSDLTPKFVCEYWEMSFDLSVSLQESILIPKSFRVAAGLILALRISLEKLFPTGFLG